MNSAGISGKALINFQILYVFMDGWMDRMIKQNKSNQVIVMGSASSGMGSHECHYCLRKITNFNFAQYFAAIFP